jgi:hypothetical protein
MKIEIKTGTETAAVKVPFVMSLGVAADEETGAEFEKLVKEHLEARGEKGLEAAVREIEERLWEAEHEGLDPFFTLFEIFKKKAGRG